MDCSLKTLVTLPGLSGIYYFLACKPDNAGSAILHPSHVNEISHGMT